MHYAIKSNFSQPEASQRNREIAELFEEVLETKKADAAKIEQGDILPMYDHERLISVEVEHVNGHQVTVVDAQGFRHVTERYIHCCDRDVVILRAIVAPRHKKLAGYNPDPSQSLPWCGCNKALNH